jgi:acyl-CoA synthetase (AMP-forming)/AMP-acid ligase II
MLLVGGLQTHPDVATAVVVAREDTPSAGKQLVAYVKPKEAIPSGAAPPDTLSPAALETYLRTTTMLNPYMIPTYYILVEGFVMTPNLKIDRKELPPVPAAAQVQWHSCRRLIF